MQSSMENVSSVDDLMALSPKKTIEFSEQPDKPNDFLTGDYITMQEVPLYDGMVMDADNLAYLDKCANRHQNLIDIGKESLFVKFDPLYAKQMLQSADDSHQDFEEHLYERDVGYETSSATSVLTDNITETPKQVYGGSLISKCGKEKPTQVVPPVVSMDLPKAVTTQAKPTPVLVRSVSAILSSSHVATDRLISISGSTPPTAAPRSPRHKQYGAPEVDRLQSLRVILQNQDQEVLQLRQENRELKSSLQDTEHKFSRTREEMENRIKKLTDERDTLLDRECKLVLQLNNKTLSNKQMCIVMEEYEKTISSLIDEQQKIILERDQALNHLSSMESSFNDLLAKYEKSKSVILEVREREKMFNLTIAEYEAGMHRYEELYNNLKQITADNLEKANETLENIKKSHSVEITKMNATVKKHEVMISSLQESLTQKIRDNEELTRICDQLINEVRETDLIWCFNEPRVLDKFITTCDSDHNEGYSSCGFDMSPAGRAMFHGYLDTRVPKDGRIKRSGYCAIRSKRLRKSFKREATFDWNLYNTVVLKIRGDGRSYLLNISCEGYYDITWNDIYHYVLYTRGGPYWQIAKIPFSKFILGSKGRIQDKQSRMRLDKVTHFGISCGDKINGVFNLEIEYIGLEYDPTHDEDFAYEMYKTDRYIVGV